MRLGPLLLHAPDDDGTRRFRQAFQFREVISVIVWLVFGASGTLRGDKMT